MRPVKLICRALALLVLAHVVLADVCSDAVAGNSSIFINEFHYDNDGTDVNEGIEVLMPKGTDWSTLSLSLYNGDTASAAVTYGTPLQLSTGQVATLLGDEWNLVLVTLPSNGLQNGGRDGIALIATCGSTQQVLQFICYEGTATASNGPAAGKTCTDVGVKEDAETGTTSVFLKGTGNVASNFTWIVGARSYLAVNPGQSLTNPNPTGGPGITPGTENPTPPAPSTCSSNNSAFTRIAAIQGSAKSVEASTPLTGTTVTVKGVVVGTTFGQNSRRGFYVADVIRGTDPDTSDSIFVFVNSFTTSSVAVGDLVIVTGRAGEFNSNTQITLQSITKCGTEAVTSYVRILDQLPNATNIAAVLEPLEGCRVKITAGNLHVSDNFQLGRYGEFLVSSGDLYTATQVVPPGPGAVAYEQAQQLVRIDDGFTNQNPDPLVVPPPQLLLNNTLRVGSTVASGLEGIVVQISSATAPYYVVVPVAPEQVQIDESTNPREDAPARAPNTNLRVVATNVLNLFANVSDPASRGANNQQEYERQVAKIVNGIAAMRPDVFGVIEIANDGYGPNSTVADLTNRLNQQLGAGTFAYIDPGFMKIGTDAIACKILYQPAVLQPVGPLAVLNRSVDPLYLDNRNRPTQAQTFELVATKARFTFVIAHLKSKGSDCNVDGDPDIGDGQGNCARVRSNATTAIIKWLAGNPTGEGGDRDYLVMGDLNSYRLEDAIQTLIKANYTNLIHEFIGQNAYSYVFNGRRGYLDHAFATPSMARQVLAVSEWHINAAEPLVFDYNLEFKSDNQDGIWYTQDPVRYSDHDPVIVDLQLSGVSAPILQAITSNKKGKVTVKLLDISESERAWRLQYSKDGFATLDKATKQQSTTTAAIGGVVSFTASGLNHGATYSVRVFACASVDGSGTDVSSCGKPSNVLSVTVAGGKNKGLRHSKL